MLNTVENTIREYEKRKMMNAEAAYKAMFIYNKVESPYDVPPAEKLQEEAEQTIAFPERSELLELMACVHVKISLIINNHINEPEKVERVVQNAMIEYKRSGYSIDPNERSRSMTAIMAYFIYAVENQYKFGLEVNMSICMRRLKNKYLPDEV